MKAPQIDFCLARTHLFTVQQNSVRKWLFALMPVIFLGAAITPWIVANAVIPHLLVIPERARVDHRETPAKYDIPFEILNVVTSDGFQLKGWFVPAKLSNPLGTVVVLHGKSSCKEHMVILARLLAPRGYNTIIYDSRAQGESGGRFCTYGYREKEDVVLALNEARRRFGDLGPIGILGTSFGAAVAIETLADNPQFRCGILSSPFCDLKETAERQLRNTIHFDWLWLLDQGLRRGEAEAGFQVAAIRPEQTITRVRCPVLVLHGEKDERFPVAWGRRIYDASPSSQKEWYLARGNGHDDMFWFHDAAQVKKRILLFLSEHMQRSSTDS